MKTTVKVNHITLQVDEEWFKSIARFTEEIYGGEVCNWLHSGEVYDFEVITCDGCDCNLDRGNTSPHPDYCLDCYVCNDCSNYANLTLTDFIFLCPECLENQNED